MIEQVLAAHWTCLGFYREIKLSLKFVTVHLPVNKRISGTQLPCFNVKDCLAENFRKPNRKKYGGNIHDNNHEQTARTRKERLRLKVVLTICDKTLLIYKGSTLLRIRFFHFKNKLYFLKSCQNTQTFLIKMWEAFKEQNNSHVICPSSTQDTIFHLQAYNYKSRTKQVHILVQVLNCNFKTKTA